MSAGIKELAKTLGLSVNGVRKAIDDGRITRDSFKRGKKGLEFDLELAVSEYELNTNSNLSSNDRFDDPDEEDESEDSNGKPKKSVLDKEPKYWSVNEALQAKTIYSALKVKHELDVQEGKFYDKKDADREFLRISSTFARELLALPNKIRQKIHTLEPADIEAIRVMCTEIVGKCETEL